MPVLPSPRSERGQTSVEYVGAIVVVAALIAVFAGHIGPVAGTLTAKVCEAIGTSCGGDGGGPSPGPAPVPVAANGGRGPILAAAMPQQGPAGPVPNPSPQAPPPAPNAQGTWNWPASSGTHADRLPTGGDRPYSPPKDGRGYPKRAPGGYVDEDGNTWEWAKGGGQHGGEHWDVQHPDGSHTNVSPEGTIIGKDNFPNKRRQPKQPKPKGQAQPDPQPQPAPGSESDPGSLPKVDPTPIIVGGGVLGTIWIIGKLASPVCGPFAPLCAIAF